MYLDSHILKVLPTKFNRDTTKVIIDVSFENSDLHLVVSGLFC